MTRPEDIEFVLNHPKLQKKGEEYLVVKESIGSHGLFAIDDIPQWKKNR